MANDVGVWVDDPPAPSLRRDPALGGEWVVTGGPGTGAAPIQPPQMDIAESNLQTGRDAARGFGRGLTSGTAPYIEAGTDRGVQDYWARVDEAVKRHEAAFNRSPWAYGLGEAAGSAVVPGGLARFGLSMAGRGGNIASRLLYGGAEGALYGAGQGAGHTYTGRPEDYLENAGGGAVIGSVLSPVGPILGQGVSTVAGRGAVKGIPKPLAEAAQADREGLEAIMRGDLGERAMLTEGGPNMLGIAQGATPGGTGPGRARLINALTERNQETNPYIAGEMDRLFGAARTPSVVQQGVQRDIDTLSPHYDRAYESARAIDNTTLADWIGGRIGSTRGPAQESLRQVRGMLDIPGNPGALDPHPRALGAARSAVRGMRDSADDPAVRRELGLVYDQMTRELQAKVPGIRQLDSARAELGSRFDALDPGSTGSRMFETGRQGVIRPDELRDVLTEAARPKGTLTQPSQEPSFLRAAARAELDRIVGTNRNDLAKLRQVLAEPQDYNQQKLAVMFGQDRADGIARVLNQEHRFRDSYNKVVENSQTAQRAAAAKGLEASAGGNVSQTTIPGFLAATVNWAKNRFVEGSAAKSRDRLAHIMAERDPATIRARIPELLAAQPTRERKVKLVRDLVQSGYIGAEAGVLAK
jgi:hypothetical protein